MMNSNNSQWGGLLLLALALGCGSGEVDDQLVVINKGDPLTLTPHLKAEQITYSVQSNIFESLVEFDPAMKIRPLLAESWENPDDLTWVFKLRKNVSFHDGSRLSADDVVYSLERAKGYPASALKADFILVESIVKVDEQTVKVTTVRPCPILLNRLVNALIVPRRQLERQGDDAFSRGPVGTGPYRFASYPSGGPLTLAAFEGYWGSRPAFRKMVIWGRMDEKKALDLLVAGQADIVSQLDVGTARRYRNLPDPRLTVVSQPGLTLRYLGYNFTTRPFNNIKVRQALSLAIDRAKLLQELNQGFGQPANQLVPQAVFGFNPELPALGCDPARARKLLAQAGYPSGIDLVLTIPDVRLAVGQKLQQQLGDAGIRVTLNTISRDAFFAAVDTACFFLFGVSSTSGDASDLFDDAIHSRTAVYGRTNRGSYRNPAIDRMIESSSAYLNQSQRLQVLQDIMARCMDDLPRVPLYIEAEIYGVSSRIRWQPRLDTNILGKEAQPK